MENLATMSGNGDLMKLQSLLLSSPFGEKTLCFKEYRRHENVN